MRESRLRPRCVSVSFFALAAFFPSLLFGVCWSFCPFPYLQIDPHFLSLSCPLFIIVILTILSTDSGRR